MYQTAGGGAATGAGLAFTGFSTLAFVVAGVSLLVLGLALIRTARRVPKSAD